MGGIYNFLSERGIALGMLQRCLVVFSDCISSVYGFAFSVLVLIKYNDMFGYSRGIGYSAVWVLGEFVSMVTTLWQRYLSFTAKKVEKMFLLKVLGIFHYLLITVGTAGLVSAYEIDKEVDSSDVSPVLFLIAGSLYLGCWFIAAIAVTMLCMVFSLHWGANPVNVKRNAEMEKCYDVRAAELPSPTLPVVMIIKQIVRILLCPFYYTQAHFSESQRAWAFLPIVVLNFATLPIRIVGCFTALLLQALGWALFIGTLGLIKPLAQWILGERIVEFLCTTRRHLYRSCWIGLIPAILPLAIYSVGMIGPTLLFLGLAEFYISICLFCGQQTYFLLIIWREYTVFCMDTITGNSHGLGFRFDALLTGAILCIIMIPILIFISFWLMSLSRPNTLSTVSSALIGSSFGEVWIIFKVLQMIVSILYPLLRLYAFGLLSKLQRSLILYADVTLLRFSVEFHEVRLANLRLFVESLRRLLQEGDNNNALNTAQTRLDETSERLRQEQEQLEQLKKFLDIELENMEKNMQAIASILFDFDFSLKSNKVGADPASIRQ